MHAAGTFNNALLSNLSANTRYYYVVGDPVSPFAAANLEALHPINAYACETPSMGDVGLSVLTLRCHLGVAEYVLKMSQQHIHSSKISISRAAMLSRSRRTMLIMLNPKP